MPSDMNPGPEGQSLSDPAQDDNGSLVDQIKQQGSAGFEQIKEGARNLTDQARERASSFAEDQKGVVTQHLDTFAQAIRQASDDLSRNDQTMASQLVRQAAGGLESLSRSIHGADFGDMLDSVRRFGRSNPTAFIGGALLAGIALGRFARASSRDQHGSGDYGRSWQGAGRTGADDWGGRSGSQDRQGSGGSSYRSSGASGFGTYGGPSGGPRSAYAPSVGMAGDAPPASQGYAGGGMGRDPAKSSTGSGATATPSSATDPSVGGSSSGGGLGSGSISTGETS